MELFHLVVSLLWQSLFSKASSVQEEYQNNMYHTLLNLYIFGMYFNRTIAFAIPYLSRIGILASGGVAMLLLLGIEKSSEISYN